jgi:hypothetical protein
LEVEEMQTEVDVEEVPHAKEENGQEEVHELVMPKKVKKAIWEQKLPHKLTVANTPGTNSLCIKVQIQVTDTYHADTLLGQPQDTKPRCRANKQNTKAKTQESS